MTNCNILIRRTHKGRHSYRRRLQASKENMQNIFPLLDPDPDTQFQCGSGSKTFISYLANSCRNPGEWVCERVTFSRVLEAMWTTAVARHVLAS